MYNNEQLYYQEKEQFS